MAQEKGYNSTKPKSARKGATAPSARQTAVNRALTNYGNPNNVRPAPVRAPQPISGGWAVPYGAPRAPQPVMSTGGGGGGGGGAAAAVAPQAPAMSLEDYVNNDFFYQQQLAENERLLSDFDAESLRMRQQTEAEQRLQRQLLSGRLDDMGAENAGQMASNGLLRSGMTFQKQDRINEYGVQQENSIAQALTDLLSGRAQGRVQQETANRSAIDAILNRLTQQYNSGQF